MDIIEKYKSLSDKEKGEILSKISRQVEDVNFRERAKLAEYIFKNDYERSFLAYDMFMSNTERETFIKRLTYNEYKDAIHYIIDKSIKNSHFIIPILNDILKNIPEAIDYYISRIPEKKVDVYYLVDFFLKKRRVYPVEEILNEKNLESFIIKLILDFGLYNDGLKTAIDTIKYLAEKSRYIETVNLYSILLNTIHRIDISDIKKIIQPILNIKPVNKVIDDIKNAEVWEREDMVAAYKEIFPEIYDNYRKKAGLENVKINNIENAFDYLEELDLSQSDAIDIISKIMIEYQLGISDEIPLRIIEFLEETEVYEWLPIIMEYPEILDLMESLTMNEYDYLGNYRAVPQKVLNHPLYNDYLTALEDSTRIGGNLIKEMVMKLIKML